MSGHWNCGRRRQSTAMRVLRGNPGGHRDRLNLHEPTPAQPPASFDELPAELADNPVAEAEWHRVAPMLRTSGVITSAERGALIALCLAWSTYLDATQHLKTEGMVIARKSNIPAVSPWTKIAMQALAACTRLWGELGLTPSSRARMTALQPVDAPAKSKWAKDL